MGYLMKKQWKKKLNNYYKKAKEWSQAQQYYALNLLKRSMSMFTALVAVLSLGIFVVLSALMADHIHGAYLENKVGSNTFYIRSPLDAKRQGSGTAFAVKTPSGKVLTATNAHICELANDKGIIMIEDKAHSKRLIPKRVIEIYEKNDLCIVEGMTGYDGLDLADSVEVSQKVWALGYPLGEGLNISKGRVKEFKPIKLLADIPIDQCEGPRLKKETINFFFLEFKVCLKEYQSISTDMQIYPGNSGSPTVNMKGDVVGVVFASNNFTHWGHIVPLADLKELLSSY